MSDRPTFTTTGDIVERGEINGIAYAVITHQRMGHYCAYVRAPIGHPWAAMGQEDVPLDVHGGVTYSRECDDGMWFGWDYAHAGDYVPSLDHSDPMDQRWSARLVMEHVRSAAQQIIDAATLRWNDGKP